MSYNYDHDCPFEAFITNLGKYNEGELIGEWVKFPTTPEELQNVFERIGIGSNDEFGNTYEEWFISDYDCYVDGLYEKLGEYDTGIFGTDIVTRILFENGYADLAFRLMTGDGEISFANMKRTGTNTLWENWDGVDSLSHPMFGAVSEYIFNFLLGIRQTEESAGYSEVEISPAYIPGCGDISGSIMTKNGRISVEVKYVDGEMKVSYSLPETIRLIK